MVRQRGRYGFIDREETTGIVLQFKIAHPFFRDLARVSQGPNFRYLGIEVKIIWDPRAPTDGIFDLTDLTGRRDPLRMRLPPFRFASVSPYPPDHLYEDHLPRLAEHFSQ